MLSENVAYNGFANIVVQGKVIGINTDNMTAGDLCNQVIDPGVVVERDCKVIPMIIQVIEVLLHVGHKVFCTLTVDAMKFDAVVFDLLCQDQSVTLAHNKVARLG